MRDLCFGCKSFKEIVYTEGGTDHPFCQECAAIQPLTSDEWAFVLLTAPWSPFSAPFKPGDKVEARQVIESDGVNVKFLFEGVGEVTDVSTSMEHGATAVYPTFKVIINEKAHDEAPDEAWYPELCLTKVR